MTARLRIAAVIGLCATAFAVGIHAQRGRGRGAGAGAAPIQGPFSVIGVVLDQATHQPIRGAAIAITGGRIGEPRQTATDDQGRFGVVSLPFGRVTVRADKPGYLPTYYGSRRPGLGPGTPISLRPAAPRADLTIEMPRGGVITGVVTDVSGAPARHVQIALMQYQTREGERVLNPLYVRGDMVTDDRGVYRIWGLLPGDYLVGALPVPARPARQITRADVDWAEAQASSRGAVSSAGSSAARSATRPEAPPVSDPVRVFYPGTVDISAAATISLATGEERTNADFAMQHVSSAIIRGTIAGVDRSSGGFPWVTISQIGVPASTTQNSITWNGSVANGPLPFTTRGLPPGRYRIMARSSPAPVAPGAQVPPASPMWAMADVVLNGAPVDDVTLTMQPAFTITGRVVFDGTAAPLDVTTLRVALTPIASPDLPQTAPPRATVAADGSFLIAGVFPGRYRMMVSAPGAAAARRGAAGAALPSWTLKSIVIDGRDLLDLPIEISPDHLPAAIVATWFDRAATVTGTVVDDAGQPVSEDTVVLFPADSRYWGVQSRRTLRQLPGPLGRFQFAGVLPGEYYLALTTGLSPADVTDSSLFADLARAAVKITVAEGAATTQNLKISGR
jgi:protocatechuate 3,4-dioxygenase beta subunit